MKLSIEDKHTVPNQTVLNKTEQNIALHCHSCDNSPGQRESFFFDKQSLVGGPCLSRWSYIYVHRHGIGWTQWIIKTRGHEVVREILLGESTGSWNEWEVNIINFHCIGVWNYYAGSHQVTPTIAKSGNQTDEISWPVVVPNISQLYAVLEELNAIGEEESWM